MRKIISITTSSSPKNLWTKFVNDNRWQKGIHEVMLDFSKCSFVEPFHIVLLACLIEEYYQNGANVVFIPGENLALREYLTAIKFFGYWEAGFDRTSYTQHGKLTNLCLWKLNPPMLSPYVLHAQRYFENNFLNDKSVEPLNISLAELFNNIIDHANSPVGGYTTSQFYPKQEKVRVAVCDFGVGIPSKINAFLSTENRQLMTPKGALELAFSKSFSTKSSPQNRGFGLDTLLSIAKVCKGTLRVVSNNAMMIMENQSISFFEIKHNFQGTHFEIILDTSTFCEREEEILDDDFSF